MYDLLIFIFNDFLISSLRRLASNAACNSSLGIERDFIGANLAFPKTKAILASIVTTERPPRKATEGCHQTYAILFDQLGVSKKQQEIVSRPSFDKPVCQFLNFS